MDGEAGNGLAYAAVSAVSFYEVYPGTFPMFEADGRIPFLAAYVCMYGLNVVEIIHFQSGMFYLSAEDGFLAIQEYVFVEISDRSHKIHPDQKAAAAYFVAEVVLSVIVDEFIGILFLPAK